LAALRSIAVATSPDQYDALLAELAANDGQLSAAKRFELSVAAFNRVAQYDAAISNYLSAVTDTSAAVPVRDEYPAQMNSSFIKVMDLRYGENPHQSGVFYRDLYPVPGTLATFVQLQGKELSYNNLADADAAWECVRQFEVPACVIVKHANPCGVAVAADVGAAYEMAYGTDPTSAFGGILAFNRTLDAATAKTILDRQFVEVLIAPDYEPAALEYATKKANVRVLRIPAGDARNNYDTKRIGSGLLIQSADNRGMSADELKTVTQRAPTAAELRDLLFAWRVAKYVKSNAIVYARDERTIGVGAGQMSRVYSARIAGIKAADAGLVVPGSVMASDAFFPFRDGLDAAAEAGITAVIQPGGSMRDAEVIAAADEHGIAMVFTGVRHFRH
jgi:phosphoribosylaminoimidazolecarboxamide formyltransferase/IMP cyclohydrolase